MATWTDISGQETLSQEQQLYDHLLERVDLDTPEDLIARFRSLFIEGAGYPDRNIHLLLDQIVTSKQAETDFKYVLNRCCHILINRWQTRTYDQAAIPTLISLFEQQATKPITEYSRSKVIRRLRELSAQFTQTEQYAALQRLTQVICQATDIGAAHDKPLGTLIRRYPFLYEHCLLAEGARYEQQQIIRDLQTRAEHQFDLDLTQYVAYRVRRAQLSRSTSNSILQTPAASIIKPVINPTFLNDPDLASTIKHFAGKVEGSNTYRDLAQRFVTHTSQGMSYQAFKDDLYQYLISSVDPSYGRRRFNDQLHSQLKSILPENNSHRLNDMLVVKTCSQLLNFLVIESSQRPNHFVFIDLVSNLGPTLTTGIVIKIVLVCRRVKPYLDKRFSILFNHYEGSARELVQWLINCLETLNVAFSITFGSVDLSFML